MKLFYTLKEVQREIEKARYEEQKRMRIGSRLSHIENDLYELRVDIEKAHARIDKLECETQEDHEVCECIRKRGVIRVE